MRSSYALVVALRAAHTLLCINENSNCHDFVIPWYFISVYFISIYMMQTLEQPPEPAAVAAAHATATAPPPPPPPSSAGQPQPFELVLKPSGSLAAPWLTFPEWPPSSTHCFRKWQHCSRASCEQRSASRMFLSPAVCWPMPAQTPEPASACKAPCRDALTPLSHPSLRDDITHL